MRTLYQCFFTLPSVRVGNVLAISLQLLPASRNALSLCSSAGVHGVFVRPFFTVGLGRVCCVGAPRSRPVPDRSLPADRSPEGLVNALALLLDEPGNEGSPNSDARLLREFVGECCWYWCACGI